MAETINLPRWQSHKIVHAAKIKSIDKLETLELEGANGASVFVKAAPNMFARYTPIGGDYYVVYEDGYASISPHQAFEQGYHRL